MLLNLHVTGACNLRCDYCYASPKTTARMQWPTALGALQLASERDGEVHVIFFGGEPLLELPLLRRVVRWCEQESAAPGRYRFQLVTNGLLVDQEVCRWAAEHHVSVSVSLDGTQAAHELHRGEGSWRAAVDAVKLLRQSNPYLHVQMVLSPDTAPLLPASLQCIFDLGVRFVSTALDHAARWDSVSLAALGKAYGKAAALYEKKTLRGERFYLSCFDSRIRTRVMGACERSERCSAGTQQWSVAPAGTIHPCVQFVGAAGVHVLGSVDGGLDAAAIARFESDSEQEKQECRGCALLGRCSQWCACVNQAGTGSVTRVSPVLCEHERLLLPIADALAARLFRRRNSLFIHKHYHADYPLLSATEDLFEELARQS
jgi:uncharacterized protein